MAQSKTSVGIAVVLVGLLLTGCAGTSAISFEDARYPVSLSATVLDRDGELLPKERQAVVGKFEAEKEGWNLFYTLLPLGAMDYSDELNQQVESCGGEAVVNLCMDIKPSLCPTLAGSFIINWLPIWPNSVVTKVKGDIIRAKDYPEDTTTGRAGQASGGRLPTLR